MVKVVPDFETVKQIVGEDKVTVIDFFATWCGPCKVISPYFEQLEPEYPNINFIKIDVDENEDAAIEYSIRSMPTFGFFKSGQQIDKVVGSDRDTLKAALDKHNA